MGRAYWLPTGGIGNGLNAQTWAVLVDADASILMLLLDTLREADIPAHAVRLDLLGRRSPTSTFRISVDTWTRAPRRGRRARSSAPLSAANQALSMLCGIGGEPQAAGRDQHVAGTSVFVIWKP